MADPHRMQWTDEKLARLIKLTNQGLTIPQIAESMGVSSSSVKTQRIRIGLVKNFLGPSKRRTG